jgi:hypothetical protein
MAMRTLMDSTTGRYRVTTESGSQYIVDLDQNSLVRLRGAAPPSALDDDPFPSEPLRRDGRPVTLVGIREATVGRSGEFLVDLEEPEVAATVRATTMITSIEQIESVPS